MIDRKLGSLNQALIRVCYGLAVAALAVWTLPGAGAWAQQAAQKATPSAGASVRPGQEEEAPATSKKPGGEGIKVHGHWTVEVRNPNGSLANRVEFENSLVSPGNGDTILAQLLSGQAAGVDWAIAPNYQSGLSLCAPSSSATATPCFITGSTSGLFASAVCAGGVNLCTPGLVLTYASAQITAPNISGAGIQLQGSITAAQSGSLMNVATRLAYCTTNNNTPNSLTLSPSQCVVPSTGSARSAVSYFTSTPLANPIAFVTGQIVTFMVNITFS